VRARGRVMYGLSILAVVCLLPFAVHDFLKGRTALASAILGVVLAFAADGWAIRVRRKPPVPYVLLIVPISGAIALSIATQGVIGAFWCYPTVLFLFFVLTRRVATVTSLALLLGGTAMVYHYLGARVAVRFAASLVLTIFIINVIQNVVRELQRRLMEQAITDPLTGAFNRRHMEERLGEALARGRRRPPVSLLVIDIDHFKKVNDEHGHEAGDTVLKGLVSLVRQRVRAVDLVFRMGGEEFVVLLPDTAEDAALLMADKLRQSIAETTLLDGLVLTVSIGVGAAVAGDSVESWLKATDAALYAAKEAGRNRVARRAAASRPALASVG
jgi:diguanylate cyclase (GGDEF)-like protein